jgi:hypothetical protein
MKFIKNIFQIILIFILIQCEFGNNKDSCKNVKILKLGEENCEIYLKHVVWGLTSDNSTTYIGATDNLADTINEPYLRVIDFFYKLDEEKCILQIYKSDTLKRSNLLKIKVNINEGDEIDYQNYRSKGFQNILYN